MFLDKMVTFIWIPSHIGIHGNSKADSAAKSALQFEIVKFRITCTDLTYFINPFINYLGTFVIRVNFTIFKVR